MYRARVADGMIRIGTFLQASRTGYTVWVIGPGGTIVREVDIPVDDPHFALIEDIYATARHKARGGDQLIDSMIAALS
jgi:hypothetical protein